ncbi:hypothetical protein [Companilactobacillus ginsenosidimutans]|uniref:Uncharacterized protein n=1 Tax=Companilactobacillus ginsenosidimutans TaxID=1007676 RepID=A0A0H4QLV4_9LACO|nr:hypothetical protein [Companilactobacillus ginsenosidimutans]AKP67683.1 hypothetical protein ABM34_09190 [Companilactobacillus ginsenosidimutans]
MKLDVKLFVPNEEGYKFAFAKSIKGLEVGDTFQTTVLGMDVTFKILLKADIKDFESIMDKNMDLFALVNNEVPEVFMVIEEV